jgi:hypothetical protein
MAEKRVIELEVKENFKKVEKDIDSLNQSLKETADTTRDVNKTFSDVYGELQPLTSRMGEAEDRLYELAAAGQTASKEYKDLLKTVADYRKVQINTDIVVDAASSTMSTKMTNAIGGVANAFSVAEGASALMGVESEKLQETMVKLQAAMAISQGVQGLKEGGLAFKQLGVSAMNALKGIRTGLAATGIGLFVVALGTIVAYWDDIKAAVSGVSEEQAKLNQLSHANFETSKAELENLDAQDNILKLQGKSEREILNLKIAKVNTAIELGKIELQNVIKTSKAEEEAAIKNYKLTKQIVDFILDTALFLPKLMLMPIDMAIKGANKVSEALGFGKLIAFDMGKTMEDMQDKFSGFIAGSIFNVEEVKAEGEKTRKELQKELKTLENQKAGFQLQVKEIDKAANDKAKESAKERNDIISNANAEAARLAIEQQNELNKRLEDLAEQNFQNTLTDQERELLAVQDKYFELETLAAGNAEALAQIELAKMNEINDINLKYQEQAYEADKLAKEKKEQLEKEAKDKAIANENELRKKQLQLAGDAFSALGDLVGSFTMKNDKDARKQFQIQKAFNLAAAVTNTALAVTGALTAGGNPIKLATGAQFVEAGIAATVGAANIVKIASSKFGDSGSGGGSAPSSAGGGGGMQAPNFNVIGSSGVNQLAQIQQQPTRAYVVSGDVANGLSLERNRLQNATL